MRGIWIRVRVNKNWRVDEFRNVSARKPRWGRRPQHGFGGQHFLLYPIQILESLGNVMLCF